MSVDRPAARASDPLSFRRSASAGLAHALVFYVAASTAFAALLFASIVRHGGGETALPSVPYAVLSASAAALALLAPIAALRGLERLVPPRFAAVVSSAALAATVAPLALPIAVELASGEGISRTLPRAWGTAIATVALELVALALFAWHRLVVRDALGRGRPRRGIAIARGALGVSVGAVAFSLSLSGLEAYAFLVDVVALAFTLVAGTLLFVASWRLRPMRWALVGGWALAVGFAVVRVVTLPGALAHGREILVPTSQVAARVDRLLWPKPRGMRLRLDPAAPLRCESPPPSTPRDPFPLGRQGPRNVLLVSVDALRSDAVGWEHGGRPIMPNLSRFVAGSVRSPNAVTTYPATIFAIGSALSGLRPSRLLFAPSPPRTILSRVAARVDVDRIHLPAASWFRMPATRTLLLSGQRAQYHADAAAQVRTVVGELGRARASGKSYAIWTHFYEPHHPYRIHEGFEFGRAPRHRYASEVAYLDAQLGSLFEFLERSGAYRDTLVVFFADHGEALGERGYRGHHVYLDGFITDVPLAVRAPGLAPRIVDGVVELTDVAATVADFFGLPQEVGSDGRSLLRGDPPPDRVAISEAFPIRGADLFALANEPVRSLEELDARMERIHTRASRYSPKVALSTRGYRLIVDRHNGLRALYRRGSPSSLEENVAPRAPRELARLTARLERWHREAAEAIHCAVRGAVRRRAMPAAVTP